MSESESGSGRWTAARPTDENVYPLAAHPATARARGIRPRQVTLVSVMLAGFGLLGVLGAWLLLSLLNDNADHGESVNGALYALCYIQFALSGLQIASGLLVWQGRSWARVLAYALCWVNLLGGLVGLASGAVFQGIVSVAVNTWLIRMLRRAEVADWCR